MLAFADAHTRDLDRLTFRLFDGARTAQARDEVWRTYLAWLVVARQVGVSIHKAGLAAGRPAEFTWWWNGVSDDPTHAFFRAERNATLKEVAEPIIAQPLSDDLVYWAFPHGPHAGEPLVPLCQQYNDWLYYDMWAPAAELLFPWTRAERESEPFSFV